MALPYKIQIDQSALDDLQYRLRHSRLPDYITGNQWTDGTDPHFLQELLQYWQTTYDWRKQEALLNQSLHHFRTSLNSIDLHFVHERSKHSDALPLLLIHGWPGSFLEFTELIPLLVNPGEGKQAFHVVAPSLPGYAFSSAPQQTGFGVKQMASTFNQLMLNLGYNKYFAHGGDWGSAISKALGIFHENSCLAIHVTLVVAAPSWLNPWHLLQLANLTLPFADKLPLFVSAGEVALLKNGYKFMKEGSGYYQMQSTKPQTLGYSLNDSPIGLLAWIVEKFHSWSDRTHTSSQLPFSNDFLITNACLYWLTGNVTSSLRLYYESQKEGLGMRQYCQVPTGVAVFPKEITCAPQSWARSAFNIQRWTLMSRGGHFGAKEEPEALAEDVQCFFGEQRKTFRLKL